MVGLGLLGLSVGKCKIGRNVVVNVPDRDRDKVKKVRDKVSQVMSSK